MASVVVVSFESVHLPSALPVASRDSSSCERRKQEELSQCFGTTSILTCVKLWIMEMDLPANLLMPSSTVAVDWNPTKSLRPLPETVEGTRSSIR